MVRASFVVLMGLLLAGCQTTVSEIGKKPKKSLLLIEEPGRSMTVRAYLHDSGYFGSSEPFLIKNTSGKVLCEGSYHMADIGGTGDLKMSCFEGRIQGTGIFKNHGIRSGRSHGIGIIESDQSTVKIIYGVTDREFLSGGQAKYYRD